MTRTAEGKLLLRVAAFPARYLPDLEQSRHLLGDLLAHLKQVLDADAAQISDTVTSSRATPATLASVTLHLPKSGDLVEAILVEDPKGQNRRWAKALKCNLIGNITNPTEVPSDLKIGDRIELIVQSVSSDGKQIQFRVPTAKDRQQAAAPRTPPRGPHHDDVNFLSRVTHVFFPGTCAYSRYG